MILASQDQAADLLKIRRFCFSVALVLITYSVAGVKIDVPAKVEPLGIPFLIERPDLLALGLVIASVFSTLRFIYYGMLINPSPMRARKRLLMGKLADQSAVPKNLNDFIDKGRRDIHRYFPLAWKSRINDEYSSGADGYKLKIDVPWQVRLLSRFEDLDFLSPLIANIIALVLWIISF